MNNFFSKFSKLEWLSILAVALGYFVDLYDLLLFSAIRKPSLLAIGVDESNIANVGLSLLNWQLYGLLVGGLLWGILADKFGRLSILFGSILTYSIANLLNAYVESVETYAILRFIAGLGLAGELGVGITWVSENLHKDKRTIATMLIASVGLLGAVFAAVSATNFDWKSCYLIGGVLGLLLLLLRISLKESNLFLEMKQMSSFKQNISDLFLNKILFKKFLLCVLAGTPVFVFTGIFITLAPEFGKGLGLKDIPVTPIALIYFYVAASISDIFASLLSKYLRSRKKVLIIYGFLQILTVLFFLYFPTSTVAGFYIKCSLLGIGLGYWAVLLTNAAENFGTNLRATVTTSTPNFIRGLLVPLQSYCVIF